MPTPAKPRTSHTDGTGLASRRGQTAQARLQAADERDAIADARDLAAFERERAADARNLVLARRDAAQQRDDGAHPAGGSEIVTRAAGQRRSAARQRTQAAEQRALAAEDLHGAARDREQAANERLHALVDRELLAHQLAIAETDPLTGARTRAAGLIELDRELDRCRRNGGTLVIAYLDVVGLKHLNDTEGHGAGDELLRSVVALIFERLRSYDLVIRIGGDEFLCVMSNTTLAAARRRFGAIATALAGAPGHRAISAGFAKLAAGETAAQLIARADNELLDSRRANPDTRPAAA